MSRLHLPHPHIAAPFTVQFFAGALDRLRHHTTDDYTTPAAQRQWSEWPTPEQWADAQKEPKTNV